jgi:phosphatidylinositol glycan class O
MGDDTWTTVFPNSFSQSFPYDSFNVEDLHTVDEGVIRHLFPLLDPMHQANETWDLLVGHFLGLDHVGHRLGPEHPTMKAKQLQMNDVLKRVVDNLANDDLLVVLGDHGMDSRGDHGGDGALETSAGLWMYSKTPLRDPALPVADISLSHATKLFPGANVPHRRVQQIDLVPTISLLLGLPIPFNNLGTVIPEVFSTPDLKTALAANAAQVGRYLDVYRNSSSGAELDSAWSTLQVLHGATLGDETPMEASIEYLRAALATCRAMWAQFNSTLMTMGLITLATSIVASAALFFRFSQPDGAERVDDALGLSSRGMAAGSVAGLLVFLVTNALSLTQGISSLDFILFFAPFFAGLVVLASTIPSPQFWTFSNVTSRISSTPVILFLHTIAFFSNSFTFWEERILTFFLFTSLISPVCVALATPSHMKRILIAVGVFAVAVRAMSVSTICREEQQPYCHVTFFASAIIAVPPVLVRILALPLASALTFIIRTRLAAGKADHGAAALVLPNAVRPALLGGAVYWLADYADAVDFFGPAYSPLLRTLRTVVAWVSVFFAILGVVASYVVPSTLKINVDGDPTKPDRITVLGYANAFGAPYLVMWSSALGLVSLTSQLTAQLVLVFGTVALLAHLEVVDAVREAQALNVALASSTPSQLLNLQPGTEAIEPSFTAGTLSSAEVTPLALLGLHAFFGTGHNATIASIQWKSAFMLTPTVTYPLSPLFVTINTFGPIFLFALAAPLLAAWNVPPRPVKSAGEAIVLGSTRAALALQVYFGALLLGSASSAAFLRRHLMVWKVFAPRFMLGAASLLAVDVALILSILGLRPTVNYMNRVFGVALASHAKPTS